MAALYGFGAGSAQSIQDILARKLAWEKFRSEQEAETRRLAMEEAQAARAAEEWNIRRPALESGTRVAIATEPEAIKRPGLLNTSTSLGNEASAFGLGEQRKTATERDTARAALSVDPVGQRILPWVQAGLPITGIDALDPTGDTAFLREKELIKARGDQATRAASASQGGGGLTRGLFRTVPTIATGRFGIPAGRPVVGFFNGPELIYETPSAPTAGMKEKGADLGVIYDQLQAVKQRFLANQDAVGPVTGRVEQFANAVGWQMNRPRAEMAAALATMDNMLIYARSGKQINEQEYARLKKELPDVAMEPALFATRLQNVEAGLSQLLANYSQMGATYGREYQAPTTGATIVDPFAKKP